jgi:hypothetical protein
MWRITAMKTVSLFPRLWVAVGLLALFALPLGQVIAEEAEGEPDATIEIQKWKVGLIVGAGAGSGTLIYQGERYPLTIDGVRVGATVGVSTADLAGNVYNLSKPEDINGAYVAAQASAAIIKGAKVWTLKSETGVVLKLEGRQKGLELSLDAGGMNIALKE